MAMLEGVHTVTARGKTYHYHRATRVRLSSNPTEAEVAAIDAMLVVPLAPLPGTLGALMTSYRTADVFQDLKPATRKSYRQIMRVIEPLDRLALSALTPVYVASVRDQISRKHGRRTANYVLAVISVVSKYGIETGAMTINPCVGLRRVSKSRFATKANRPWTPIERKAAIEHFPAHVGLAVALMMFTGLRRTDCCELPRTALRDGWLHRPTSKTNQMVKIPAHPALLALLDAAPKHNAKTLLATSYGNAWTPDGLSTSFMKARDSLVARGLLGEGLTIHGLRHTVGSLLRGCTDDIDIIRRWLGLRTLNMAVLYSFEADTSDEFADAMSRFDPLG